MMYAPHKLFLIIPEENIKNSKGNTLPAVGGQEFLCNCFLHEAGTKIIQGYAGIGKKVQYYVNLDRRDDLLLDMEIKITESDGATIRGEGHIVDIKHTSGLMLGGCGNRTTIFL